MALSANTTWEIRPTVGSDANGGGFVTGASGVDYSQQNSAQFSGTDLVVDLTTNTIVTSASHTFVANDVGNLINVSAGVTWTTGVYQIVSVSTGAATLDRSPAAVGVTGGTWAEGGALTTFTPISAVYASGNSVFIKNTGSLTITSTIGTFTNAINIIGYGSTRGDGIRATITTATNSIAIFTTGGGITFELSNLILSNSAGTRAAVITTANAFYEFRPSLKNCLINGCTTLMDQGFAVNVNPMILIDTEIKNCTGDGVNQSNGFTLYMFGCYIHDNVNDGLKLLSQTIKATIEGTVIANNGLYGLEITNSGNPTNNLFIHNCCFVSNVSDGLRVNSSQIISNFMMWNTIFSSNGGYGINYLGFTPDLTEIRNCAFYNNTSGAKNGISTQGDVTLTGDPFMNAAAGDFSLNNTSGAGSACKGAGFESPIL